MQVNCKHEHFIKIYLTKKNIKKNHILNKNLSSSVLKTKKEIWKALWKKATNKEDFMFDFCLKTFPT